MKIARFQFTIVSLIVAVFFVAFILAAYSRGNFLLGPGAGLTYAFVAALITVLFYRALSQSPVPLLRLIFLTLFAIPVSLAFAFPTYLNSDVQHFVNKQKTDRNARAELAALFAREPAFQDLAVSTTHLKVVNVEVLGSVPTKGDLDRLRSQVLGGCQFVDHCFVHWRIRVRDESKTYTGFDDHVLDAA